MAPFPGFQTLLRPGICRRIFIMQDAERNAKEEVLIAQDQKIERIQIAPLYGFDQSLFGFMNILRIFHTNTILPRSYRRVPEMSQFCNVPSVLKQAAAR